MHVACALTFLYAIFIYICVHIHIYIHIYTHTHIVAVTYVGVCLVLILLNYVGLLCYIALYCVVLYQLPWREHVVHFQYVVLALCYQAFCLSHIVRSMSSTLYEVRHVHARSCNMSLYTMCV